MRGVVKRYAVVKNAVSARQVEAYLPGNYKVIASLQSGEGNGTPVVVIEGTDDHGWTLDAYVIPRLASGLIWAEEIDLSHPVMKEVPA